MPPAARGSSMGAVIRARMVSRTSPRCCPQKIPHAPPSNHRPMPVELSPDTLIREVVENYKGSEAVFAAHGLPCAGCHVSVRESIRGGASVHHLDLDALMSDLQAYVKN